MRRSSAGTADHRFRRISLTKDFTTGNNVSGPREGTDERALWRDSRPIITNVDIRVETHDKKVILARGALTGVDCREVIPSVFGMGGASALVFRGQGAERVEVKPVKPKVAQEVMRLLGILRARLGMVSHLT